MPDPTIEEVCALVAVQLGRRRVTAADRLVEDLGAESVDRVNVVAAAEERWGVVIDEADLPEIRTPADLHVRITSQSGGRG